MLVSHDRALLRAVCDEFWLVSRGGVGPSTATWTTTSATCSTRRSGCARKRRWRNQRRGGFAPARRVDYRHIFWR